MCVFDAVMELWFQSPQRVYSKQQLGHQREMQTTHYNDADLMREREKEEDEEKGTGKDKEDKKTWKYKTKEIINERTQ